MGVEISTKSLNYPGMTRERMKKIYKSDFISVYYHYISFYFFDVEMRTSIPAGRC